MDTKEFKYYKDIVDKDVKEHDTQLSKYNAPEDVINAYKGVFADTEEQGMVEN